MILNRAIEKSNRMHNAPHTQKIEYKTTKHTSKEGIPISDQMIASTNKPSADAASMCIDACWLLCIATIDRLRIFDEVDCISLFDR